MGTQQTFATILGAVLLLVGLVGLFTVHEDGKGMLLVFGITHPHNAVHILSGILGLVAGLAAGGQFASVYNKVFGLVYGLVTVLGFLGVGFVVTLLNINTADNFLHLAISLASLGVGFGVKE